MNNGFVWTLSGDPEIYERDWGEGERSVQMKKQCISEEVGSRLRESGLGSGL